MRIAVIVFVTLVLSACAMQEPKMDTGSIADAAGDVETGPSSSAQSDVRSEPRWLPLVDGSDTAYDAHDFAEKRAQYGSDFSEMVLNNGARLRQSNWDNYLEGFVSSLPATERHEVLDGITRHFHEYDRVEGAIRFEPLRLLSGPYARTSYVALRGVIKDQSAHAFLRVRYYGKSWLFVDGLTVVVDGDRVRLDSVQFARDHSGGNVWEYADLPLDNSEYRDLAKRITEADEVIIRFHGKQYYSDLEVSQRMKEDLRAMLVAVSSLNGW